MARTTGSPMRAHEQSVRAASTLFSPAPARPRRRRPRSHHCSKAERDDILVARPRAKTAAATAHAKGSSARGQTPGRLAPALSTCDKSSAPPTPKVSTSVPARLSANSSANGAPLALPAFALASARSRSLRARRRRSARRAAERPAARSPRSRARAARARSRSSSAMPGSRSVGGLRSSWASTSARTGERARVRQRLVHHALCACHSSRGLGCVTPSA